MSKLSNDNAFLDAWNLTNSASRVTVVTLPRKTNNPLTHHEIIHDQNGQLWCGPAAIAALTGATTQEITELIKKKRKKPSSPVVGTDPFELDYVFSKLKCRMTLAYLYGGKEECRPTVGRWLKDTAKERVPGIGYIIHMSSRPGDPEPYGHWGTVLDGYYICTNTKGWVPIEKAPFRRCRINAVFAVRKTR